jgi:hypothetical protein
MEHFLALEIALEKKRFSNLALKICFVTPVGVEPAITEMKYRTKL